MQKITLIAVAALTAASASAQYTCDPTVETVLAKGKVSQVMPIALDEGAVAKFEAQGANVTSAAPNDADNNLWVWQNVGVNTMDAGDASYPGVGDQMDGYASFIVGTQGWSGAGYNVAGNGVNTEWWNADTRFHLAYMSPGTAPASIAIIVADGTDMGSQPAKVALGDAFNDNGAVFPAVGPKANDDWQGIDISFSDLKKLFPTFDWKAVKEWKGNIMSFLGGGIAGQAFAFDAIYYYQLGDGSGINGISADETEWVVTANTVNVAGANGIKLYNLGGQLVKKTAGTTLGLSNLAKGVYVAKSGNQAKKIVVK